MKLPSFAYIMGAFTGIFMCVGYWAHAQQSYRYEVGLRNDNDVYLLNKQDQYYTNGLLLFFRKAFHNSNTSSRLANTTWEVSAGQKMYNAYTAQIDHIEDVDRPFTAYLYANAGINRFYRNESTLSLKAEIGLIGKKAFGKPIQETFHRVFGLYAISGWQYQLESALGTDLSLESMYLLYRNKSRWFDLSLQSAASLGLNHTGIATAPVVRLGQINALYQSAYTNSRIQASGGNPAKEFFFYYSPQINLVIYDATVQGGFFLKDKGPVFFKPTPWVFSHRGGVMYARHAFTFNLQYVFNTRELKSMLFRHRYGSLSAYYRF